MLLKKIILSAFLLVFAIGFSQEKKSSKATFTSTSVYMKEVGPLSGRKLIPEIPRKGNINPRRTGANRIVPGKGLPRNGKDPLLSIGKNNQVKRPGKAPSLTFEVNSSSTAPTDPTGAIGPNHYISAKNSAFAIHDRSGNEIVGSTSLASIFPGETLGDPIVFYDSFADRFVITQFSNSPNGFLVAVGQGPDPVNDGWFTYRFNTGSFPDYTKFSIWSDGYYVTANKDQGNVQESEVVFVIDRERMLKGEDNVDMVGFPLPGARIGGFYSPASFNAIGTELPPEGGARIVYFQDDEWAGVTTDILKFWEINVDWFNLSESSITEAEELTVTPFDSTFDGGSFGNLPQPGSSGQDIDVLQGAVMFATNYRRFCDYNAVVLNFPIDIDTDQDNIAAIRWYELRQTGDGQPWTVHQEGTYTSPDGKSAWCASMAMDIYGNIGMGYTTMGTTDNGAAADSFASIRYTGRLAGDPLGTMTIAEQTIAVGSDINRTTQNRYGDYAQITVDPVDDSTFWHIAEYFESGGNNARNIVGVFKVAEDVTTDVGVVSIDSPTDATLSNAETITVTIKNFGTVAQSDIPVDYAINGGAVQTEMFAGPIAPGATASFSFASTADLAAESSYEITVETNLTGDVSPDNDCFSAVVRNLLANDVGIRSLVFPTETGQFTDAEEVTITIFNFGGSAQSNIPVFYTFNGGAAVNEVFTGTIEPEESATYTFTATVNMQAFGTYEFEIGTALVGDQLATNDTISATITNELCAPTSDCAQFGDGIISFELANVSNRPISCGTGYEDFTQDFTIQLNRNEGEFSGTVQSGFGNAEEHERFSIWIDFNDNNIFETSELIVNSIAITLANSDVEFSFSIPNDTPLGTHLFRIRGGDTVTNTGGPLNEPCQSMQFGSTHDYTVEIVDGTAGPDPSLNTNLTVISEPDNQFLISKVDSNAPEELRVYIFSISGQIVASNLVKRDANNRFEYPLDMSFARSGVYFARFGESKSSSDVAGFVVR